MPKRSCCTNLVEHTSKIVKQLELRDVKQVDIIYTDFTKAFDRLNIRIIVEVLNCYGINGTLLKWFESFLVNRWQYVKVNGCKSEIYKVHSGVPQGSHCGPTLFNIVMNLIPITLKDLKIIFYADDAKFFLPIKQLSDCNLLQQQATDFYDCCNILGLELNVKKCKVMSVNKTAQQLKYNYMFGSTVIERVACFTDLGIIFNQKFTFKDDLTYRISKARSMLDFIKRQSSEFRDPAILRVLYFAFVRSKLEYCSQVWDVFYSNYFLENQGSVTLFKNIEKVQANFLKYISRYDRITMNLTYNEKCTYYGMQTLATRRTMASSMFCFDTLTGMIDAEFILSQMALNCNTRNLRNVQFMRTDKHRSNYGQNEPINAMLSKFNQFQDIFDFNIDKIQFKKLMSKKLICQDRA